ncbi:MAG TPA: CHAD domain-containing protein [Candidatus Limnocylindrales bacterium]|nr:CHAD domain-containing protein [Candidatus Limnocylindrales bacterium]
MSKSPVARRPIEVELKYRLLEPTAGDRYLIAEDLGGFRPISPVRSTQLEDRYLDTADGALARAGFAARLRQTAQGTTVSVKSTARRPAGLGPHRREELEGPADRTAGPRDWPPSDARSLILEQCGDAPLVELVTIRQLRRKRQLEAGATVVELSLDEVDAVVRSRVVQRFMEIEVELVEGDEAALDPIDRILADDAGLVPSTGSKLESALQAIRATSGRHGRRAATVLPFIESGGTETPEPETAPEPEATAPEPEAPATPEAAPDPVPDSASAVPTPPAATATPPEAPAPSAVGPKRPRLTVGKTPGVLPDDHLAEAGRKVLRFHLARMIAREAGTREGSDPEELHSMRVATRRQRAAWRVFGDAFRPGRTRAHRTRLRDVAARLGTVRDLDVLLEAADRHRAELPASEQRALEPLLAEWRTHRDDARRLLVRELDSEGYRRWIDDYAEFVRQEGLAVVAVAPTQPHRVRDTAGSRIVAAYETVRAYEPVLRWADVETLHDLRIAAKRLRYTIEFVREALGPESAVLIERVTALQDHLGELNDANVTAHLVRSFLVGNAGSLNAHESATIARYLVGRERDVVRLRRTVGGPWRGVAGVSFRRALARTIASL